MESSSSADRDRRLRQARIGLALGHPFIASSLMRLPFKEASERTWCPTMATDGYHVFFNPLWTARLTDLELQGVLAHEVLHVVFGHNDRMGRREPEPWNMACDHAINLLLHQQGVRIPAGGLADRQYLGMTAEQIYDKLLGPMKGAGVSGKLAGGSRSESQRDEAARRSSASGLGDAETVFAPLAADLVSPDDLRLRGLQDPDAPDREQRGALRKALVADVRSRLQGTSAGYFAEELALANTEPLDWTHLLRAWLTDRVRSDWRSFPFARKHLHRGLFLPSVGVLAPGHVVFAIDTSASMDDAEIAAIANEIAALRGSFPCRLTVLQCDAAIQSVEEFEAEDLAPIPNKIAVKGRGGTDFRPVFAWVEEHADAALALLIYATDGYGTYPAGRAPFPCLWIITANGRIDEAAKIGAVVRLESTFGGRAREWTVFMGSRSATEME
jgi:predicted metal-dependent peptidase